MDNIKVSIIIPVYNTSLYLEKCLRTVMNQSLKEVEIICVNDGSTDNSLEILEKLQKEDNRIIIINKKNGGLTSARNAGLKVAKGEYIIHIDSDDWIDKNYLDSLYKTGKNNDLDIVVCDFINEYISEERKEKIIDLDIENNKIISNKEAIEYLLSEKLIVYLWNKLIRREIYIKNKILLNEKIKFFYEDWDLIYRLCYFSKKIGKVKKEEMVFYHYRIGDNNGSTKIKLNMITDFFEFTENVKNFFIQFEEKKFSYYMKRIQILGLTGFLFDDRYDRFSLDEAYKKILDRFLINIREVPFILKKSKLIKEGSRTILYFNLIKIFPKKTSIKILKQIRKILKFLIKKS